MPTHSLHVLARIDPVVRPGLAERAAAWTDGPAAPARTAASVILLRERGGGLETYLLHRHARMAFAPSTTVFPGGKLESGDAGPGDAGAGDAIRACAVRETREETGVALDPGALLPWAHWVTPEPEPLRYDTHFFAAALPAGQSAADVSGETDAARWYRPADALARTAAGELAVLPPTLAVLTELVDLVDLAAVAEAAAGRVVATVLPEVVRRGAGWAYRYPVAP